MIYSNFDISNPEAFEISLDKNCSKWIGEICEKPAF